KISDLVWSEEAKKLLTSFDWISATILSRAKRANRRYSPSPRLRLCRPHQVQADASHQQPSTSRWRNAASIHTCAVPAFLPLNLTASQPLSMPPLCTAGRKESNKEAEWLKEPPPIGRLRMPP